MANKDYEVGSKVKFKKEHPCGGDIWEVTRVGMDIKAECCTCGRQIMMPRNKFDKNIKKVLT